MVLLGVGGWRASPRHIQLQAWMKPFFKVTIYINEFIILFILYLKINLEIRTYAMKSSTSLIR